MTRGNVADRTTTASAIATKKEDAWKGALSQGHIAAKAGRLVVLHKDYSDKDGEEALRRAMWKCGHTNNAVTRYIADAIAEKLTREEAEAAMEKEKGANAS